MQSELIHLKKKINELIETRTRVISSGQAKDFAQYRQMVGEKTGLELAIREINDLHTMQEQIEDGDT
jgi:hypothetical protein